MAWCVHACVHILVLPTAKLFSSRVKQTFKVLSTTMSKHLFAIRGGRKTDIQHNARTLPQSLPIFYFFSPCPFSSLSVLPVSCSPPTPPLCPPPTLTPTPPPAAGSCLPPCLFEGVHFPLTLGGRGMLSGGCRQTHMFRTLYGRLDEPASA